MSESWTMLQPRRDEPMPSKWPRTIAHADMDAFYAAVEQLDDARLRGRPVLVGSLSDRGVVLTASYEARPFGVGSAMAMARARRLCPDAVVVPPRFERYRELSKAIMQVFAGFSPQVEALSLDEAFLDLTGTEHLFGDAEAVGGRLKQAVREVTGGLTASVGVSATKFVAKVASGYSKPDGLTVVPPDAAKAWLAPLPVSRLWGVGPKTEVRLRRLGLHTIADVAAADPDGLKRKLGSLGVRIHALAHGEDARPVQNQRPSISIGSERTLETDVADRGELKRHLRRSAEDVARRLRRDGVVAYGVRVKLKTAAFQILTRQQRMQRATDVADEIYAVAADLLDAVAHPGPFRLVGMTAYDLVASGANLQLDLFNPGDRHRRVETAIDALTQRYGSTVVHQRGDSTVPPERRVRSKLD